MKKLLYLKDHELKQYIEKIFMGYRETVSDAKKVLDKYSIGVAHNKVIHLISLYEGITISELLKKLKITKQSLNRVLKDLIKLKAINYKKDEKDTRIKHVYLTEYGIKLFEEISPIDDSSGERFEVRFIDHEIREPIRSEEDCRKEEVTYSAPLYVTVELKILSTQEVKQQVLFMGDIPKMTKYGTFIINGAERVIVSQLVRSPGAYFQSNSDPASGRKLTDAKIIPYRGAWIEIETSNRNLITVKIDRKRKSPITTFLRCLGIETDEEILKKFKDIDNTDYQFIKTTLDKDSETWSMFKEAITNTEKRNPNGQQT